MWDDVKIENFKVCLKFKKKPKIAVRKIYFGQTC